MCMQSEIYKNVMSAMMSASSCVLCCVLGILIGMALLKGFDKKGKRAGAGMYNIFYYNTFSENNDVILVFRLGTRQNP